MGSASEPRSRRYLVGRQNQNSRTSTPPPCCRPPPPKPPEPTLQTSSRRPRSRSSPQGQIPLPVNFRQLHHPDKNRSDRHSSCRYRRPQARCPHGGTLNPSERQRKSEAVHSSSRHK